MDDIIGKYPRKKDSEIVQSGPFKCMECTGATSTYCKRLPRLLGCYDGTLRPLIDQIISCGYPLVIDMCIANSCYCVGLAMQMPQIQAEPETHDIIWV